MSILVTGGAGYIGSHTIIDLIESGYEEIVSIDNFSNSTSKTFDRIEKITGKRIKNYNVDCCDLEQLTQVFEQEKNIQGIIHFAAFKAVGESVEQPLKYYHNNIESLVNMLKCTQQFGIKNFIFSSSCSVYGNIDSLPVTESTPLPKAESPYAFTKQIGEQMLIDFIRNVECKTIALRYFNPVGAHESGLNGEVPVGTPNNLVPFITQTAIGLRKELTIFGNDYDTIDGTCIRDYIHVSDIAHAHVLALEKLFDSSITSKYSVINLGTGLGVSVKQMVEAFERVNKIKLAHVYGPRRAGDSVAIYADNQLAKEVLGWTPKHDLDSMMRTAWKWEQQLNTERN